MSRPRTPQLAASVSQRLALLAVVIAAVACLQLFTAAHAQAACQNPNDTSMTYSRDRCIGGVEFPARQERLEERCLKRNPIVGETYPSPGYCGGTGAGGEAIAQARAIAYLNRFHVGHGVDAAIQWEVTTRSSGGRADITHNTGSSIDVYEVKLASNLTPPGPWDQVDGYIKDLKNKGVTPLPQRGTSLTNPNDSEFSYLDAFAVTTTKKCDDIDEYERDVYVSFLITSGVIMVKDFKGLCYDWRTTAPPLRVPVTVKSENGQVKEVPIGQLPDAPWQTLPNTYIYSPSECAAGQCVHQDPNDTIDDDAASGTHSHPHMVTFDGLSYEFMAVGEFELAESDSLGMDVQVRTSPVGDSGAYVSRVAFVLNGYRAEYDLDYDQLLLDGKPIDLEPGTNLDLGDGAYLIHRQDGAYLANWPSTVAERPIFAVKDGNIRMWIPPAADAKGLLGDRNGTRDDDLKTFDGEQLPPDASPPVIYGAFANGWRISDDESLFTYPGWLGTEDYTNRSFPPEYTRLADLSDEVIAEATSVCTEAGVADGPQFDECILDWAVTRDQRFVEQDAAVTQQLVEGGARGLDEDGEVSESFEDDVASNFSSPRLGSGAGTGRFAGPFGGDSRYVFYVPDVSRSAVTLDLNLITLGGWSPFESNTVQVIADDQVAWKGNPAASETPASSGVTPSGTPYSVYALRIPIAHRAGSIRVGITGEIPLGSARAFAIDDVHVHAEVVPSQAFSVSMPAVIEDGRPAAGAGNFETVASEDNYDFTTSDTGDPLLLDFDACTYPDAVEWTLVDRATGRRVPQGIGGGCKDTPLVRLPVGDYRLSVTSYGRVGTYKLTMSYVAPQSFDVALPVSISDGAPMPGAGNLETSASSDTYRFTTTAAGSLRLDFSDCSDELADISWTIRSVAMADQYVTGGQGCSTHVVSNLVDGSRDPVRGEYKLVVYSHQQGSYKLRIATEPSDTFDVALPVLVSDGAPAGAGRLEDAAASDAYLFTPASDGQIQLELSDCSPALTNMIHWQLIAESGQVPIAGGNGCSVDRAGDVFHGAQYRLVIDHPGQTGVYKLAISMAAPVQKFALTLPASVSDGVPSLGAGNLETITSEDQYTFTTAETGTLRIDLSSCSDSFGLPGLTWELTYVTGSMVMASSDWGCSGDVLRDMPVGTYRLAIKQHGATGTYGLSIRSEPMQDFNVSLPASVSDGVPTAGAGRLETPASGDGYRFTSPGGILHIDLSDCTGIGKITWRLVWLDNGAEPEYGTDCHAQDVEVSNGAWKLVVENAGAGSGTYKLGIALDHVVPEEFGLDLPDSVPKDDDSSYNGAGDLETTQSVDVYTFYRQSPGPLELGFSDCSEPLDGGVDYRLTEDATGEVVATGTSCSTVAIPQYVPDGWYRLSIKRPGRSGTYRLAVSAPRPIQAFDVSLPFSAAVGVPGPGAGRLELKDSWDVYRFTMAAAGSLQLDVSELDASMDALDFTLVNAQTGATQAIGQARPTEDRPGALMADVPAGDYELRVSRGFVGTYKLSAYVVPAPERFDVALPFSASDGVPATGAGRLETTSSKDVYRFTKSGGGPLQIDVSDCTTGLGTVSWMLVNDSSGAIVTGNSTSCAPQTISSVNTGTYRLEVTRNGFTGTYHLGVSVPPQTFSLTLPATVSSGVPASGAGSLETTASEDIYRFSTTAAGALQLDFSSCGSGLGGGVDYRLSEATTGATVSSGSSCSSVPIANVPAGDYRLSVSRPGKSGSYRFNLAMAPPPDVTDVTLPASVTGNLETTASEDVYRFTTTTTAPFQVDISTCSTSLATVSWKLLDAGSGATVASSASTCAGTVIPSLAAGSYRVSVTRNGKTGTYKLALNSVPPQAFNVTLPATISNGVPGAGAGNVELAASEDRYQFATTSSGSIKLAFSTCSTSLGTVRWTLVNTATGATIASNASSCATTTVPSVPAGSYRVSVTGNGKIGIYKVTISKV